MKKSILVFIARWVLTSLGIWIAVRLLGTGHESIPVTIGIAGYLLAGLIFSAVNAVLRPLIVLLSLPAILLSLGLFMLVVNGVLVYISLALTPGISMTFFNSIITGIILSLINYIVSAIADKRSDQ